MLWLNEVGLEKFTKNTIRFIPDSAYFFLILKYIEEINQAMADLLQMQIFLRYCKMTEGTERKWNFVEFRSLKWVLKFPCYV